MSKEMKKKMRSFNCMNSISQFIKLICLKKLQRFPVIKNYQLQNTRQDGSNSLSKKELKNKKDLE